jgi:P27 family predicted phage terminase small subunit
LPPAVRAAYRRLGRQLVSVGLLGEIDGPLLCALAVVWTRWIEAENEVQKTGLIVRTKNGFPIMAPALTVANSALRQMRYLCGEFGMSPASRSRVIAAPTGGPEDEFEEFLKRGRRNRAAG